MNSTFWFTTDLDGTLIPVAQDQQTHFRALEQIRMVNERDGSREIVFVTGRHLESVVSVMEKKRLPVPHSIITDVGSSIWRRMSDKESGAHKWVRDSHYDNTLDRILGESTMKQLEILFRRFEKLELQPEEQQGRYKLSYFCRSEELATLVTDVSGLLRENLLPFSIVASVDPFNGQGLIDLLPVGVDKLYAIEWFRATHMGGDDAKVVYAGDSGNDLQVFLSEIPSIIVANTPAKVVDQVKSHLAGNDALKCKFFATSESTSGVLEGLKHYQWIEESPCS